MLTHDVLLVATAGALLLASVAVIIARRMLLASLLVLGLLPAVLGVLLLGDERAVALDVLVPFAIGTAALLFGCASAPTRHGASRSDVEVGSQQRELLWKRFATTFVTLAVVGSIVNFYNTGIPILADNVEVGRFVDGSSFRGLPNRLYQFGLPLSAAAALAHAAVSGVTPVRHRLTQIAFAAMVVGGILSGFKSGLIAVVVTFALLGVAAGHTFDRAVLRRLVAWCVASVVFAIVMATQYGTYRGEGVADSLLDRLFVGSAEGPVLVFQARPEQGLGPTAVGTDARYFAEKYFSIGEVREFAFHERVSSTLTGTPLRSDAFLVPITTTAVADVYYDVGLPLAVLVLFVIGYLLQRTEAGAARLLHSPSRFLLSASVLLGGYNYATRGGFIYAAINWLLVLVLLLGTTWMTLQVRPLVTRGRGLRGGSVARVQATKAATMTSWSSR